MAKERPKQGVTMDPPIDQSFAIMFAAVQRYLTAHEAQCIINQFSSESWLPGRQVLWESVEHAKVEEWAKRHSMQTLSIALGPLLEEGSPQYLKAGMNRARTSKFMRGAGALFTWYISLGGEVTIVCRPPPERFHPGRHTNFQQNELPILRTAIETSSLMVYMVHPDVERAADDPYQVWPCNETEMWTDKYGKDAYSRRPWRSVSKESIDLEPLQTSALERVDDIFMRFSMKQMAKIIQYRINSSSREGVTYTTQNNEAQEKAVQQNAVRANAARESAARERAAREKAVQQKAEQQKAAQQKAAQEKAAQEKAAQQKAAQQKAEQQKAAQQKAAQEKAAQQKAAQQKAAQQKAAQQKAEQQKVAQQKAAQEKAAQQKAAQQKAAQQKAAQKKAMQEKAIQEKATESKAKKKRAKKKKTTQNKAIQESAIQLPAADIKT